MPLWHPRGHRRTSFSDARSLSVYVGVELEDAAMATTADNQPIQRTTGRHTFLLEPKHRCETSIDCKSSQFCKLDSLMINSVMMLALSDTTNEVCILWEVPEASLPSKYYILLYHIITRCVIAHNLSPHDANRILQIPGYDLHVGNRTWLVSQRSQGKGTVLT